jgi:hypothetical protein
VHNVRITIYGSQRREDLRNGSNVYEIRKANIRNAAAVDTTRIFVTICDYKESRGSRPQKGEKKFPYICHKMYSPYDNVLQRWDVRREFMQRLSMVLHGTLGSYPRDALQEGVAAAVACLSAPRAKAYVPLFFLLCLWIPTLSSYKKNTIKSTE